MEWIHIKDDWPLYQDYYLVALPNGHICIGYWMSDAFWSVGYYSNRLDVTHWMHLPEPPEQS